MNQATARDAVEKTIRSLEGHGAKREHADIEPIKSNLVKVEIVGDSALHVHAMSAKTAMQIEDASQGKDDAKVNKGKKRRPPKDPWSDFCHALHVLPGKKLPWPQMSSKIVDGVPQLPYPIGTKFEFYKDTFGFPTAAIGKGIRAILRDHGFTKIEQAGIWVHSKYGSLMPLTYDELIFERVACRVGPYKVADMHYRGLFGGWSTEIAIEYDTELISLKQLLNAVNRAGRYCGLGEQRKSSPLNPGDEGMYHVRTV